MIKNIALCLSFLIILYGCSKNGAVKDYKKFAAIYVDILLVQEMNKGDYKTIHQKRNEIYAKYGINEEQFVKTIMYYNQDSERWGEFFGEVNKRIAELKKSKSSRLI